MLDKIRDSADAAIAPVQDGAVIMVGGFMCCGTPELLIGYNITRRNPVPSS